MPDTLRDIQATVTNTKGVDILLQIAAQVKRHRGQFVQSGSLYVDDIIRFRFGSGELQRKTPATAGGTFNSQLTSVSAVTSTDRTRFDLGILTLKSR